MGSSKNYKKLTNVLHLLVVITLPCLLEFCEASQCHTCHDGGIPIAPDDYSPSCKENNNDISQSCGDEVDQCAQFKAFENGKTVVLSKGCNWPRSCLEQTFRVGKEVGCKTIQGKEYNEKCPGRPSLRKFRNGTGTGPEKPGEIVEIKNEWTVEWCVCPGTDCNKDDISGIQGGGNGADRNSLKWTTGSGLVIIAIASTVAKVLFD